MRDLGAGALADFIDSLPDSGFRLVEPTTIDFRRSSAIIRQYADANIDFADAILVAMAERLNITKILTIDQRHFRLFRPKHCTAFELFP